jgi:hypothetical protein
LQRTFRGFAAICGATIAVGVASALSNVAFAQAPAAPASTATPWTFQGLFDDYYLYDGNIPKSAPEAVNTQFNYDELTTTPALSLAELNIAKAAPAAGGLGFKTTLMTGETPTEITTGQREDRYEDIMQLYITLAAKSGAGVDLGKFYTPFGYEVVESNGNYNYSRSFIFSDLLPVYHTGLRVYTPSYKGLVATGYVVESVLNADPGVTNGSEVTVDGEGVSDANKSLGFIGQLNYTAPSGKYTAIETYGGSHDGPNGLQDAILLSDMDITVTPTAVDTIGLNWTNRQDKMPEGFTDSAIETANGIQSDPSYSSQSNGYAVYYRRQVTAPYAVALRAEEIQTKENTQGVGPEPKVDSLTATLEDKATKSLLLRLELRHDDAKVTNAFSLFPTGFNGGQTAYNGNVNATQNTISLSGVWTFGP